MGIDEKLKEFLSKSAKVSKEAFSKAGDAVQEFSDKSVVKIDIKKLEMKKSKKFCDLGEKVYKTFSAEKDKSVSLSDEQIKTIFDEIIEIEKQIEEKNKVLAEADAKSN